MLFTDFIIFALVTVAFCQDVPEVSKNETESSRKERGIAALAFVKFVVSTKTLTFLFELSYDL